MGQKTDPIKTQQEIDRVEYAHRKLTEAGIVVTKAAYNRLEFMWKGSRVMFWPFTGWATGKTIQDGRGIHNLLKQLTDAK